MEPAEWKDLDSLTRYKFERIGIDAEKFREHGVPDGMTERVIYEEPWQDRHPDKDQGLLSYDFSYQEKIAHPRVIEWETRCEYLQQFASSDASQREHEGREPTWQERREGRSQAAQLQELDKEIAAAVREIKPHISDQALAPSHRLGLLDIEMDLDRLSDAVSGEIHALNHEQEQSRGVFDHLRDHVFDTADKLRPERQNSVAELKAWRDALIAKEPDLSYLARLSEGQKERLAPLVQQHIAAQEIAFVNQQQTVARRDLKQHLEKAANPDRHETRAAARETLQRHVEAPERGHMPNQHDLNRPRGFER